MKRALITAATSSIGKVIARQFSKDGYELVLHFNENQELADKLATELQATLLQADLSTDKGVQGFIVQLQSGQKFDLIVNNAALTSVVSDKSLASWERMLRVNAIVPALLLGNADTLLNDDSVVINISSIYGHERFGDTQLAAYSASKAALNSLTRTFAKKLAPRVRVNAIAPGYVESRWNQNFSQTRRNQYAKHSLTGKLITPQQVADLATHIASNTALDGEVIYLDGGLTLKTI